jgi:hypothetical protein
VVEDTSSADCTGTSWNGAGAGWLATSTRCLFAGCWQSARGGLDIGGWLSARRWLVCDGDDSGLTIGQS